MATHPSIATITRTRHHNPRSPTSLPHPLPQLPQSLLTNPPLPLQSLPLLLLLLLPPLLRRLPPLFHPPDVIGNDLGISFLLFPLRLIHVGVNVGGVRIGVFPIQSSQRERMVGFAERVEGGVRKWVFVNDGIESRVDVGEADGAFGWLGGRFFWLWMWQWLWFWQRRFR